MYKRLLNPSKKHSFFLFGARGTGKSSLLSTLFKDEKTLWIDLLKPEEFKTFSLNPEELTYRIEALDTNCDRIIIDEIQRIPKLLNLVHHHIENSKKKRPLKFALTGSSSRQLKRSSANLLAGRALIYNLFPLTAEELAEDFNLQSTLNWGTLPEVVNQNDPIIKRKILQAYTHTYLKEEILAEQIIRQLDPFHLFLSIAGQMTGKIINYSAIARDCQTSDVSIKEYFQILEDTLIGFHLRPYNSSIRKRLRQNPKFYIFDTGVSRSLAQQLLVPVTPQTSNYGDTFENWLICEIFRLISYAENDFQMFYLRTKDDAEIDLILERPSAPPALIEIKSTDRIVPEQLNRLKHFIKDFKSAEAFCLSNDTNKKIIDGIRVIHWKDGLRELNLLPDNK